ncbi:MAG: tyrosine-type recombinase/integrase [Phaeobacter italicus]
MTTQHLKFSDRAIRAAQVDPEVARMRDARYPMELRFLASRQQATWFYIWHAGGSAHYRKIGRWPLISANAAVALLPDIAAEVARKGDSARIAVDHWTYVAELLDWYQGRISQEARASQSWRASVGSAIRLHLRPRLGALRIGELTRQRLDEALFAPLQGQLKDTTIDLVWRVLRNACIRAVKVHLLAQDPLKGVVISDFLRRRPEGKHGALRPSHVPAVMDRMHAAEPPLRTLIMLMLVHGTRIGETRQARWADFDLAAPGGEWYVSGRNTKTRAEHHLPLVEPVRQWLLGYQQWQAVTAQRCALVFPGVDKRTPLSAREASRGITTVGRGEWTARHLRSLCRTLWEEKHRVQYLQGEWMLNHAEGLLDRTYNHADRMAGAAELLEQHVGWLAERGSMVFDSANGGSANGGSANGGSANGGLANAP